MFAKPRKGVPITMPYKAKKSNYPLILHPILIFSELARNYPYLILHPILHPNPHLNAKMPQYYAPKSPF